MPEEEITINRKISVWRRRAIFFVVPMFVTIPLMAGIYGLLAHIQWGEDDVAAVLGMLVLFDCLLFIPYAVCVNRLVVLTGYQPPFLRTCLAGIITWPLYVLISLYVLDYAKKVLKHAGYDGDDFHSDSDPFSESFSE